MSTKYNIKQRYKTVQGLRSFKDTLPTTIKKILTRKGEIYSKTLDNWKYLVGHELFKICYPKSFRKSNIKGKTLTIMVKHGYEVDVEYSKQLIMDKLNFFFGKKIVQRIVIKTFDATNDEKEVKKENVTKNRFNKKIYNIKNKSIKKSLIELNNVYKK